MHNLALPLVCAYSGVGKQEEAAGAQQNHEPRRMTLQPGARMTGSDPTAHASHPDRQAPEEIRLTGKGRNLRVTFVDGCVFDLSAEYLRVHSPSAEVQGHSAAERRTIGGKLHVCIRDILPVGHYAVRLVFDDGHDSGLYTWNYLHGLGHGAAEKWAAYERELADKGLSRDRPGQK